MDLPQPPLTIDEAAAAVETAVRAKLVESYVKLVEATEVAVTTLIYVAIHGRREEARVMAAREILDRANLSPDVRAAIEAQSDTEIRRDALLARLDAMQEALTAPLEETA